MLFTLQINPDRGDQAIASKELAVDHQHQQILGHRPLHQPFQFFSRGGFPVATAKELERLMQRPVPKDSRGGFPVATDARALHAIALQAALNGSLVVPSRALPHHLSSHRFLQFSILLKRLITGQADLFVLTAAQTGSIDCHFASPEDHVTGLMPMPANRLLAPWAELLLDLRFHDPLDDRQAQLGGEGFYVIAHAGDQFTQRQLGFQAQSFSISCFFFGLLVLSDVLSHRWFSWLIVSFCNRPSCLMGGRRTTSNFNYRRGISERVLKMPKFTLTLLYHRSDSYKWEGCKRIQLIIQRI